MYMTYQDKNTLTWFPQFSSIFGPSLSISLRQYHKLDNELLDKILLDDSWSVVFYVDDINVCTEAFAIVLKYFLDVLVPLPTT